MAVDLAKVVVTARIADVYTFEMRHSDALNTDFLDYSSFPQQNRERPESDDYDNDCDELPAA